MDSNLQSLIYDKFIRFDGSNKEINTILRLCSAHTKHHSEIARLWLSAVQVTTSIRQLNLFRLVTHLLVNLRGDATVYVSAFLPIITDSTRAVRSGSIKADVANVFSIWRQKKIYHDSTMDILDWMLNSTTDIEKLANLIMWRAYVLVMECEEQFVRMETHFCKLILLQTQAQFEQRENDLIDAWMLESSRGYTRMLMKYLISKYNELAQLLVMIPITLTTSTKPSDLPYVTSLRSNVVALSNRGLNLLFKWMTDYAFLHENYYFTLPMVTKIIVLTPDEAMLSDRLPFIANGNTSSDSTLGGIKLDPK